MGSDMGREYEVSPHERLDIPLSSWVGSGNYFSLRGREVARESLISTARGKESNCTVG